MNRITIFVFITSVFLFISSGFPLAAEKTLNIENSHVTETFYEQNNSTVFADELLNEISKDPSGKDIQSYIAELIRLAPAVGRNVIAAKLSDYIKQLEEKENKSERDYLCIQILRLSIDELENDFSESIKHFSILKKWNISGPWKVYGKPDIDYQFQPENVYKLEDVEKRRILSADENGILYPYKFNHQADETIYVMNSFRSISGIILWISADAGYSLRINGREISRNKISGRNITKAFALSGARGYTVEIKMQSGAENNHPYIRGMVTDKKNVPAEIISVSNVYNYTFTSEEIYNSDRDDKYTLNEPGIMTGLMKKYILSGNYMKGYKLGVSVAEKFPSYFPAYKELIPLLDLMNRNDEFLNTVEKFSKLFPDSDIRYRWLAEFYRTRNRSEFFKIMKTVPAKYLAEESVKSYFYMLCEEKKYQEALNFSSLMAENPSFRHIIPEVLRVSGSNDLWRKSLIEGAALRDEADFYYSLGLAEKKIGLDPVMYWRKSYFKDEDPGIMRDLSDLYENGVLEKNDFYSGVYTDLHPEFGWNGKKRKVSVHIFQSGRIVVEGEDIIPSGRKIRNEKYSTGGSEFSSGEISTSVPYITGIKILYVLTAKDGLPSAVNFKSDLSDSGRFRVRYKSSGEEEFSVIKYSGEYRRGEADVFTLMKKLVLKSPYENVSLLDYEVVCHGNFIPFVNFNGLPLVPGKFSEGVIKFVKNEKFSADSDKGAVSEIHRFSSDDLFAQWYNKVILYAAESVARNDGSIPEKQNRENVIKNVHYYINSVVSKDGEINFSPRKMETVLREGKGTAEERALLARMILERTGIQSFISFRKNKAGLIDKILLYVPEDRDRGYWLDFYDEGVFGNKESGYDAIVITGEGYKTFPVNPETYIR